MNLKFVKNFKASEEAATMLLYQEIGGNGINGAAFAEELYWLSKNVPLVNIRINSPGGSIFEGYSIYSAMREVKIPVDTYNDFIAASMAGIIAQQGRKRYAADNSLIMLHNPQDGGEGVKDNEVLGLLKNSLIAAYEARTGNDGTIISGLMDVETWVEARQVNGVSAMLEMGLADKLFSSSVKTIKNESQIYNVAKLYSISNSILNNEKMDNEKIEQLTKQLSDLSVVISELTADKEAKELEITNLKAELLGKDSVLKEASDKLAVELIENAIKDGKVKAEVKDKLITDAKNSFEIVKNMLESMPSSTASRFTNVINSGASASTVDAARAFWTIKDYEEKDPKALGEIFKNDKDLYNEMFNKYYKK